MTYIYGLIDPRTQELRYVGKSDNPFKRLNAHISEARKDRCAGYSNVHKLNWINSVTKSDMRPELFIIEEVKQDDWISAERFWISYFLYIGCALINATGGGEGTSNPSIETRVLLRAAAKKRYEKFGNPMDRDGARKKHQEIVSGQEWKIANSNRAKINNPMSRPGIRERHLTSMNTDETKIKISIAFRGNNHPMRKRPELRLRMMGDNNVSKRPDVREKISKKLKGRPSPLRGRIGVVSDDTRRRLSESVRESWKKRRLSKKQS